MPASPPPRRTSRGDKFVGSSDEEEFCNEPPQLRTKAYRKKKSASDSASEGIDSGVESRVSSPKSSPTCTEAMSPKGRSPKVQKTPLFKDAVRGVVEQANAPINVVSRSRASLEESAIRRQARESEKKTACGRILPSAAELAAHFGGKDFGDYDNGSVTVVRQYGIDLFSFK